MTYAIYTSNCKFYIVVLVLVLLSLVSVSLNGWIGNIKNNFLVDGVLLVIWGNALSRPLFFPFRSLPKTRSKQMQRISVQRAQCCIRRLLL